MIRTRKRLATAAALTALWTAISAGQTARAADEDRARAEAIASAVRDEGDLPSKLTAGGSVASAAAAAAAAAATSATAPVAPPPAAAEEAAAAPAAKAAGSLDLKAAENQIPVSIGGKQGKPAESDALRRALFGAAALAIALGAVVWGTKKYAKRSLGGKQNAKIQVLAQHFLGPKKSLAIVHVAGESMLLGITDHNVSLIKSLSLIDDEVPENLPNHFDAAMEEAPEAGRYEAAYDDLDAATMTPETGRPAPRAFEADDSYQERDSFAMRGLSEIRDVVSSGGVARAKGGFFGRFSSGDSGAARPDRKRR